jgi:hypothetical protein
MPDTLMSTDDTASRRTRLPAEIAAAVAEVMGRITSMPKAEHNDHAGYAFASIDAFLGAVGPLCAAAGLIVLQDEDGLDLIERGGKTWLRITYAFTLAHQKGVVWDRPLKRTVFQRIDGPQTTGGTQSYALKQFLRSLFQIPTGERDDADFQPKEDLPAAATGGHHPPTPARAGGTVRQPGAPAPGRLRRSSPEAPAPSPDLPRLEMVMDDAGQALPGRWVKAAVAVLIRLPTEEARRHWLEQHEDEVAEINAAKPEYAAALEQVAVTGERPRPTVDEDKARLEALLADLHRAGTVQRRDDLLQEYAPRAADILARRPDLEAHWLTALDTVSRRFRPAAAT